MKNISYPIVKLFVLYLLSYGLMLFNNGVYCDDWGFYNQSDDALHAAWADLGRFYVTPFYAFVLNSCSSPAILFHVLTFILYFFVSVFVYYTLPYLKMEKSEQFMLTALFTVLPINAGRIFLCCFQYSIGIFFCFAAIYCFTIAFYRKQPLFRLGALISSAVSFLFLQSTYVFLPLYIAFHIALDRLDLKLSLKENIRRMWGKTLKYFDFVLLTIASWVWSLIFAYPTVEGYNSFSLAELLQSPIRIVKAFVGLLFGLLPNSTFYETAVTLLLGFVIVFLLFLLFRKRTVCASIRRPLFNFRFRNKTIHLPVYSMVGIYFFVAGILAYVLVGHRVSLEPVYCSRHQILLGIGFALVLLDFLIYLKHIKRAFILLLSFCVIGNIDVFLKFQAVHYAQLALMTEMGKQEQLIAGGNFCIINALPDSPFFNDLQTQHSYCGMAKKTFGDETRFLIDKHAYTKCLLSGYGINVRKATYMNMKDMTFNGTFDYFMIIDSGTLLLKNHGSVLKIMFEEYFAKDKFVKDIDELLTITCVPYQQ